MSNKKEMFAIYSAGLIQGMALVAFPAASTILTNSQQFDFSSTMYGSLFIPQSLLAIASAALNPFLCRQYGSKRVFLAGLIFNLISMGLLALSALAIHDTHLAYGMLFAATGCLGLGFGMTVPTLNAMAALFYPTQINSVLLILNALLGVGTALAPVFTSLFTSFGYWWELPAFLTSLTLLLILYCVPLKFPGGKREIAASSAVIPGRIVIFIAFALIYGIIETLNGNWISIYMKEHLHADFPIQSLALTAFWGMVAFGRIFFAMAEKFITDQLIFQIAPFISAVAILTIAILPEDADYWAIVVFGLTGFGCSVLLPLSISFGNEQLKSIASSVPGMIISSYLLGYGIAAFGVGPLEEIADLSLRAVYGGGAFLAFTLGIISLFIIQTKQKT